MDPVSSSVSSASRRSLVCETESSESHGPDLELEHDAATSSSDRTAETPYLERPYVRGGDTHTKDSEFVEVAWRKGRDGDTGIEIEEGLVSSQWGAQNEVVVKVGHLGMSTDDGTVSVGVDALSFRAAAGIHNPDGSTGLNVSLHADVVSADATVDTGAARVGSGVGIGAGTSVAVGIRDKDGDGHHELCFHADVEHAALRGCISLPF
ncbi:MAG: hypothetical protein U0169_20240 [Polyangiaceae bacterium]